MNRHVTVLRVEEGARFDPDRLEVLCSQFGEHRAEQLVAQSLDDITHHLAALKASAQTVDLTAIAGPTQHLFDAADLIGMISLKRVASDVLECLDGSNDVALAATLARLMRIGDQSIRAVWDLEDLSG